MPHFRLGDGTVFAGPSQKAGKNMEISRVNQCSFLVKFNGTETRFINELAVTADCKAEKIIADLTFFAIIDAHAQMRLDEMMKTHDDHWDH